MPSSTPTPAATTHRSRSLRLAAACLTAAAALTLTACKGDSSDQGASKVSTINESAESSTTTKKSDSDSSGSKAQAPGGHAQSGSATTRCTIDSMKSFIAPSNSHASAQKKAVATLSVTNFSGETCTLQGYPGVAIRDDSGKTSTTINASRSGAKPTLITLQDGQSAAAQLLYDDVNREGSASGRLVCPVEAATAQVTLPDTKQTGTVQVDNRDGVGADILSICGKGVTVTPLAPAK
ncbi:DUF4232 domain-containing protein [Streptomyces sp. KR80]|uniref:DUF4232 domain-containing protein n=1 Tax=Streptomyces sp. KR80 TaxID=3457426 RepID=UPI003FD37F84